MNTFYLIPQPGLIVRDPETREALPADGAEKPANSYWLRRLADGDVRVRTEEVPPRAAPVKTKPQT